MKKTGVSMILTMVLTLAMVGSVFAANPNPRVIPNRGPVYGYLGAQWWQWAFSFDELNDVPFMNTGGAVDISAGQSGPVWFLAGQGWGVPPVERWGQVPAGVSLFFPLVNLINDYPCPDPDWEPDPGETYEHFLQRTGNVYLDDYFAPDTTGLFAEIDGVEITNLVSYRAASSMFTFTASTNLQPLDPCITGTPQYGVALGYWLLLPPLTPGTHTLHFGYDTPAIDWDSAQDITYYLTVTP